MVGRRARKLVGRGTVAFACVLATALAVPAAAGADTVVAVVNSNGNPQAVTDVFVDDSGSYASVGYTDAAGKLTVDLAPHQGDLLRASRCFDKGECNGLPEGRYGAGTEQPISGDPASMTLVVPALEHPDYIPFEPAASNDERALLGLINDERARRGLQTLVDSALLRSVSDRYVTFLARTNQFDHDAFFDPTWRIIDAGYPALDEEGNYGASEVLSGGVTPRGHFEGWMNSPGHRDILMEPGAEAIGIAMQGDLGLAKVTFCPAAHEPACQLTGDRGDSSLAGAGNGRDPELELAGAKQRRKKLKLLIGSAGVTGGIAVTATRGEKIKQLSVVPKDSGFQAVGNLGRGVWVIEASFPGDSSFAAATACAKVKLVSPRKAKRPRKAKISDC